MSHPLVKIGFILVVILILLFIVSKVDIPREEVIKFVRTPVSELSTGKLLIILIFFAAIINNK